MKTTGFLLILVGLSFCCIAARAAVSHARTALIHGSAANGLPELQGAMVAHRPEMLSASHISLAHRPDLEFTPNHLGITNDTKLIHPSAHQGHVKPQSRDKEKEAAPSTLLVDAGVLIYWSCILLALGALYWHMKKREEDPERMVQLRRRSYGRSRADSSILDTMFSPKYAIGGDDESNDEDFQLSENLWALVLVASLGQAKTRNGDELPVWLVAVSSLLMGCVQMVALFLMIHDLDPLADPITIKASSKHGSAATVNSMKVAMVIIMNIALVGEAGQCQSIFHSSLCVGEEALKVPRWIPLCFAAFQYIIALTVVFCSVSVILSFQSVTDIVYSSMSLLSITHVDEMFYQAFRIVFKFKSDFNVPNEMVEKKSFSLAHHFVAEFMCILPLLFGFQLFVRSWCTGVLPTSRVRMAIQTVVVKL